MTSLEKTFAFGIPVLALVVGGAAIFGVRLTSNYTSPPQSIDITTTSSGHATAAPQRPWIDPHDQDQVLWHSTDGVDYWVEVGVAACVANPTDTGTNIKVPGAGNGLSRQYPAGAGITAETDLNYIVCDSNGKLLAGPFGLHVKP